MEVYKSCINLDNKPKAGAIKQMPRYTRGRALFTILKMIHFHHWLCFANHVDYLLERVSYMKMPITAVFLLFAGNII